MKLVGTNDHSNVSLSNDLKCCLSKDLKSLSLRWKQDKSKTLTERRRLSPRERNQVFEASHPAVLVHGRYSREARRKPDEHLLLLLRKDC